MDERSWENRGAFTHSWRIHTWHNVPMETYSSSSSSNAALRAKYATTAWVYDILDAPWERMYRTWRPALVKGLEGTVLEAGVGTGRNLPFYPPTVDVLGIDLSPAMLRRAEKRRRHAACRVTLEQADATNLSHLADASFDAYLSTFMYCVMPDLLQPSALQEMMRVLRPGGRFRLLEMVYSEDPKLRRRQELWAPFVERVYGARFDRNTLRYLRGMEQVRITQTRFLHADTYLLIEGTILA